MDNSITPQTSSVDWLEDAVMSIKNDIATEQHLYNTTIKSIEDKDETKNLLALGLLKQREKIRRSKQLFLSKLLKKLYPDAYTSNHFACATKHSLGSDIQWAEFAALFPQEKEAWDILYKSNNLTNSTFKAYMGKEYTNCKQCEKEVEDNNEEQK